MDFMKCPSCSNKFKLVIFEKRKNNFGIKDIEEKYKEEIMEGLLECGCGKQYPVIGGIPRILPTAFHQNPHFYKKYKNKITKKLDSDKLEKWEKDYEQTKKAFEFQWEKYGRSDKIYGRTKEDTIKFFFKKVSPKKVSPSYFKNKLCVDGGCGHGLYLQFLGELGAEVVGVDLGRSVEIAYERNKNLPKVHIIQTDIMNLPILKNKFDYVYSIGVIHHTPDTRNSFNQLAKLIRKGGYYAVWVYPVEGKLRELISNNIRKITTKIPPKVLYYLCYIPVPLLTIVRPYSGTHLGKNTWKECVECVYDWFSPEYQTHHTSKEVAKWFKEEGFREIEFMPLNPGVVGIKTL